METRKKGLLQFLIAGLVFAAAIYLFMQRDTNPYFRVRFKIPGIILLLTPGGLSLAGFVQFVSGVPFSELSDKWDALQGWQRGVYGTLIFFFALALAIGVFMLYAFTMSS